MIHLSRSDSNCQCCSSFKKTVSFHKFQRMNYLGSHIEIVVLEKNVAVNHVPVPLKTSHMIVNHEWMDGHC